MCQCSQKLNELLKKDAVEAPLGIFCSTSKWVSFCIYLPLVSYTRAPPPPKVYKLGIWFIIHCVNLIIASSRTWKETVINKFSSLYRIPIFLSSHVSDVKLHAKCSPDSSYHYNTLASKWSVHLDPFLEWALVCPVSLTVHSIHSIWAVCVPDRLTPYSIWTLYSQRQDQCGVAREVHTSRRHHSSDGQLSLQRSKVTAVLEGCFTKQVKLKPQL